MIAGKGQLCPNACLTKDREILSIILELTKAVRCCRQDGICCEDISFTQFTILDTIAGYREMDMTMLSKVLSVDKSTTTRLVAPLIRRTWLLKKKSRKDLRMVLLKLTKEGRTAHAENPSMSRILRQGHSGGNSG
ncbi:MAG: MarR family transcriptional regulator [Desulfobacterales bacterium]|nr:MarR family transcriptional regulator [Desulfobacterales bacterium]